MPTDKHWDGHIAVGTCSWISAISDHGYLDVFKICLSDVDDTSAELGRNQTVKPGLEGVPRLLAIPAVLFGGTASAPTFIFYSRPLLASYDKEYAVVRSSVSRSNIYGLRTGRCDIPLSHASM